jgi:osmoprotectant transport system permease protein
VTFIGHVLHWFTVGAHWQGQDGVPHRVVEHLLMSGGAVLTALVVALPIGLGLGHTGRGGSAAINVTNVGRALPSFGVLVLFAQAFGLRGWPGFGARPALVALVLLAVPPIVTNTYVGVRGVDPDAKDAARGMGMTGGQMLRQVELPLALPLIMAGIRTSAVQVVATATLAAVTAWGGLGRYIVDGFAQRDNVQIFAGALLVAVLALATEITLAVAQRLLAPGGAPPRNSGKNDVFVGATAAPETA